MAYIDLVPPVLVGVLAKGGCREHGPSCGFVQAADRRLAGRVGAGRRCPAISAPNSQVSSNTTAFLALMRLASQSCSLILVDGALR